MQAQKIRKATMVALAAVVLSGCAGEPTFEDGFIDEEFSLEALVGFEAEVEGIAWLSSAETPASVGPVTTVLKSADAEYENSDFERVACLEFDRFARLHVPGMSTSEAEDSFVSFATTVSSQGVYGFTADFSAREFANSGEAVAYVDAFAAAARECGGNFTVAYVAGGTVYEHGEFVVLEGERGWGAPWARVRCEVFLRGDVLGEAEHELVAIGNVVIAVYSQHYPGLPSWRSQSDELIVQIAERLRDYEA